MAKIRKVEVKTIYTIEYTCKELLNIIVDAPKDKTNINGIFDDLGGEDCKLNRVKDLYKGEEMLTADELTYIANKLGFDGWEFAGTYNKERKIRTITVYNNGDTINI